MKQKSRGLNYMDINTDLKLKQNRKNISGFTFVEIIVVIVIIGILAAIIIPGLTRYIDFAREKADLEQLGILNRVTKAFRLENSMSDPFLDTENNSLKLMGELVTKQFLSEPLIPKLPKAKFEWSLQDTFEDSQWIYLKEIDTASNSISHIFRNKDLNDYPIKDFIWGQTEDGFYSSYGVLFVKNPKDYYSITSVATLSDGGSNNGGYGIFFETTLNDKKKDTGYVLQFDRGKGGILINSRDKSSETTLLEIGNFKKPNNKQKNSDIIPLKEDPWWTNPHSITLKVSASSKPGKKELQVSIDGKSVLESYEIDTNNRVGEKLTGLRSWHVRTDYEELVIQ